jgi:hypothetical protein
MVKFFKYAAFDLPSNEKDAPLRNLIVFAKQLLIAPFDAGFNPDQVDTSDAPDVLVRRLYLSI